MDRRQVDTKRAGGGLVFSKPHKELPVLPEGNNSCNEKERGVLPPSLPEAARAGFRAAASEGSGGRGGGLLEDDKKRRLSPPFASPPPSSSLYASSPGAAVRPLGGGGSTGGTAGSPALAQPCCQAEKCSADLTEAKRYHRRHKVCETHSKAPVVVVAGLRQRFCQQCSRFHELSEFDDAKRSCRRRLAGHNERRRKSSCDGAQEEAGSSSTRCRQTDHSRKMPITMPATAAAPAYKHFQIR